MRKTDWYIKQGQLSKDNSYKNLANKFLQKARQNLITMSILSELNDNKKARDLLKAPKNYDSKMGCHYRILCNVYCRNLFAS